MLSSKVIFVLSAIFIYSEAASLLDNHVKCSLSNLECQKNWFQSIVNMASDTGIPDIGIASLDPYEEKDQEIIVMGMVKVAMPVGLTTGMKTCRSEKFHSDLEKQISYVDLVCEFIHIEGQYKIEATPTLDALLGGIKVHGEGKGGIHLENIKLNLEIPFEFKKLEDGEAHAVINHETITFTYEVLDKAAIFGDNFYIGSQEISAIAVNIFNENWKFITQTFGKSVVEVILKLFIEQANKFFAKVSIQSLITDDISSHITK